MRYSLLLLIAVIITPLSMAQEANQGGTIFHDLSFVDALKKADQEGKMLFVDCYTKTCGPCLYMVREIFPLKECGDYFNENFVCIKKDMEEGDGLDIAKKYQVGVYPTYLIIKPDGMLYTSTTGSVSNPKDAHKFIQRIKDSLLIAEMDNVYASQIYDDVFMGKYIEILKERDTAKLEKVLGEVISQKGVDMLDDPDMWLLVDAYSTKIDGQLFRFLFNNRTILSEKLGEELIQEKLMNAYSYDFRVMRLMDINFKERAKDVELLQRDHYPGAKLLKCKITLFQIIKDKEADRINEILEILGNDIFTFTNEAEQADIVSELAGIEKVANPDQLSEVRSLLQVIVSKMQSEEPIKRVDRIIERVTPKE